MMHHQGTDPAMMRVLKLQQERDRLPPGSPERERINRRIAMLREASRPAQPKPLPVRKAL